MLTLKLICVSKRGPRKSGNVYSLISLLQTWNGQNFSAMCDFLAQYVYHCKTFKQVLCKYIWLTHWGQVTHICVSKQIIIGSDNGLSPGRRPAIIWTNAGIWSIEILRTNFNGILSEIHTFSLKKMHLKMSSGKWRPFCLGLNVLISLQWHVLHVLWWEHS